MNSRDVTAYLYACENAHPHTKDSLLSWNMFIWSQKPPPHNPQHNEEHPLTVSEDTLEMVV